MGALAGREQVQRLREQVRRLAERTPIVYGDLDAAVNVLGGERGADTALGAFASPIVLRNERPFECLATHELEAFG